MRVRPVLKRYDRAVADGEITLLPDTGIEFSLSDPDGQVAALLDLLDGSRSLDEVASALRERWPSLSREDVEAGIAALDQAALLEDVEAATALTARQRDRYASNLEFFATFATLDRSRHSFQEALREARVVLLGVGGLGSCLLMNLAGLGVGSVTLLDFDRVELKNLVRQFAYDESMLGRSKVECAAARVRSLNSEVDVDSVERRVEGPEAIEPLLDGADLVLGALDQPNEVRYWVNEACVAAAVPLVTGGFQAGRGLYYSVDPGRSGCAACLRLNMQPEAKGRLVREPVVNRGIGPVATVIGSLIALEAVRYLTGFAPPVAAGKLWLVDFATGEAGVGYEWSRAPDCPVCADMSGAKLDRLHAQAS
jgi:molybdopterin/thiamine biosynthesis adenylyltransferase